MLLHNGSLGNYNVINKISKYVAATQIIGCRTTPGMRLMSMPESVLYPFTVKTTCLLYN